MLYLIDAGFLINGADFNSIDEFVTVPSVFNEFKELSFRLMAETALREEKLRIVEPKQFFLKKISNNPNASRLSKPDKDLVAVALEFKKQGKKFVVVTDDFALQNFLTLNNIQFVSVMQGRIKKTIKFEFKCSQCGKKFSTSKKTCDVCGGKIVSKIKFN